MSLSNLILIIVIAVFTVLTLALWKNPKTNPVARLLIAAIIFMSVSAVIATALTPPHLDTDKDGIENSLDIDDDGDKYLDTVELAAGSDPLDRLSLPADHDGDFLADISDPDDDIDGIADAVELEKGSDPFDPASVPTLSQGKLTITYINVGQALSILIQDDQGNDLLFDGGNNADAPLIIRTLKALKVDDLEVVIGSHYHEDHIGGLDEVIEAFDVQRIILPNTTYTTTTYKNLMAAVNAENAIVDRYDFKGPFSVDFGDTSFEIIGPLHPFLDDQNNLSLIMRMSYDTKTILLMGDADKESEALLIDYGYDLDADILGIGHHGSRTSSSEDFVSRVTPEYGIISVGSGNSYGLPDEDVLARYEAIGTILLRTDVSGTITLTIENETITVSTQK